MIESLFAPIIRQATGPCPDCMKKRAELIICQNCKHHTNKPSKCEFFGFVNRKNDASLCDKFEKK